MDPALLCDPRVTGDTSEEEKADPQNGEMKCGVVLRVALHTGARITKAAGMNPNLSVNCPSELQKEM